MYLGLEVYCGDVLHKSLGLDNQVGKLKDVRMRGLDAASFFVAQPDRKRLRTQAFRLGTRRGRVALPIDPSLLD